MKIRNKIKKLQDSCKHKWEGVGAEGLGGYSKWQCTECGKYDR